MTTPYATRSVRARAVDYPSAPCALIGLICACNMYVNMCHHGAEEWEEVVQRLMEEDPEEEFKTDREEATEKQEERQEPVPADD